MRAPYADSKVALGLSASKIQVRACAPRHQAVRKLTECSVLLQVEASSPEPKKANKQRSNSISELRKTEPRKG